MQISNLDSAILLKMKSLNGAQKNEVLEYMERIKTKGHPTKKYRSKALRQIRQALSSQ